MVWCILATALCYYQLVRDMPYLLQAILSHGHQDFSWQTPIWVAEDLILFWPAIGLFLSSRTVRWLALGTIAWSALRNTADFFLTGTMCLTNRQELADTLRYGLQRELINAVGTVIAIVALYKLVADERRTAYTRSRSSTRDTLSAWSSALGLPSDAFTPALLADPAQWAQSPQAPQSTNSAVEPPWLRLSAGLVPISLIVFAAANGLEIVDWLHGYTLIWNPISYAISTLLLSLVVGALLGRHRTRQLLACGACLAVSLTGVTASLNALVHPSPDNNAFYPALVRQLAGNTGGIASLWHAVFPFVELPASAWAIYCVCRLCAIRAAALAENPTDPPTSAPEQPGLPTDGQWDQGKGRT